MLSFIKKLSVVGVVLAASMMFSGSASAVSILPSSAAVDIVSQSEFTHDAELLTGVHHFEYNFKSSILPQPASTLHLHADSPGGIVASNIFWKDTGGAQIGAAVSLVEIMVGPLNDIPSGAYIAVLSTLFDAVHEFQTLVVHLTTVGDDKTTQYTLKVAAVPVPPALLLFGSSILGIGLLSRRRRRKTSLTAA